MKITKNNLLSLKCVETDCTRKGLKTKSEHTWCKRIKMTKVNKK